MRIMAMPIIKTLVMHHGIMPFDDLDTVLEDIKNFMLFNPGEFIFMDLDFEDTGKSHLIKVNFFFTSALVCLANYVRNEIYNDSQL